VRKWIAKIYRPAGFMLLGAFTGSGLTLAIQGKLSTTDMVRGMVFLLGLGVLVAGARKNKALFFLAICLLWGGDAVRSWMRSGRLFNAIFLTLLALIFAWSAWAEYDRGKKKRADEIAQPI